MNFSSVPPTPNKTAEARQADAMDINMITYNYIQGPKNMFKENM